MSTTINVTVDDGGLPAKNRQQTAANRQAFVQGQASQQAAQQGVDQRAADRRAAGLDPATGRPLASAGTSSRLPRIDQEPAANRRGGGIWTSPLTSPPTLIYNGPLIQPEPGDPSTNFGPSAFGSFRADGRQWEYSAYGTGMNEYSTDQSIISYQFGSGEFPYLLCTHANNDGINLSQSNVFRKAMSKVTSYDKSDLTNPGFFDTAVVSPSTPSTFSTFTADAWLGVSQVSGLAGGKTDYIADFRVALRQVNVESLFTIIAEYSDSLVNVLQVLVTGNPAFQFPFSYTPSASLSWQNIQIRLTDAGTVLSIFTRASVSENYTLIGSQVLSVPVPSTLKSIASLAASAGTEAGPGINAAPPPAAIGPVYLKYP